jgi:hypothetical protein
VNPTALTALAECLLRTEIVAERSSCMGSRAFSGIAGRGAVSVKRLPAAFGRSRATGWTLGSDSTGAVARDDCAVLEEIPAGQPSFAGAHGDQRAIECSIGVGDKP